MKKPPKHIIFILHVAVWLMLFFVSVSIQFRLYGFTNSIIRSSINLSVLIALFYFHFYLINAFFEKKKYFFYVLLLVVVTIGVTLARIIFNEKLLRLPLEEFVIDRTFTVWLFGIVTAVVALVVSFLYQMVKNRYEKERQHLEIIKEQNEARIQYLKAQINPHFLFNTLNNIYSLSVVKSDATPEMILKLSSILRYAIYEGEKGKVPLQKELEQLQELVGLFKMKNEIHPDIRLEIEGDLSTWEIEPMLLIPLLENAFKHGDFEDNSKAFAHLKIAVDEKEFYFSIINTKTENRQKDEIGGVGLANIGKRLQVNYPGKYFFETKNEKDVFNVELKLWK